MKRTLVGLHVPKCAGTSLLNMAQQELAPHEIYQNTSFHKNFRQGRPEFLEIRKYEQLKFVWGHFIHEEMLKYLENPFVFTYLRHPDERLISNFLFMQRLRTNQGHAAVGWNEWVKTIGKNPVCHFIVERFPELSGRGDLLERSINVLKAFDFVGTTEGFDETSKDVLRIINLSPEVVTANQSVYTGEEFVIPSGQLDLDTELYCWVRKSCKQTVDPKNGASASNRLLNFLSTPVRHQLLTRWLAKSLAQEYSDFGMQERAITLHQSKANWHAEVLNAIGATR